MPTTIRTATPEDLAAVRALVHEPVEAASLITVPGEHYMLVLDADDGGLAAAAELLLEDAHGDLRFLAIAECAERREIEARVLAVVESICEAFGAAHGLQSFGAYGHRHSA